MQAGRLAVMHVGTDDDPSDVVTKYIGDGLGLDAVRMKRSLDFASLSAASVVLQGCAGIVRVEGTATGSTAAVRVSAEMGITLATGCLVL